MATLIPKIIHYCWFGNSAIPKQQQEFIEEWKSILTDYQFIEWNERNSPMYLSYMQTAYEAEKWANMSNYVRLHALYLYGGIYLDTDIKLLKSFDDLLKNKCFLGFESDKMTENHAINNAIMGAVPKFHFIKKLKTKLLTEFDGTEVPNKSSPILTSKLLKQIGVTEYGLQSIESITLYPKEYFYPFSWDENFDKSFIKKDTYTIHFWAKSWWIEAKNNTKSLTKKKSLYDYFRNKIVNFIIDKILQKEHIASQIAERLNQKRLKSIFKNQIVIRGIFKDIKYQQMKAVGSALYPKLLGTYEKHLNPYLYDLLDNCYEKIINIGCGEGYFTLGLAKLFPHVKLEAYDIKKEAISLCKNNIKLNNLTKQIQVFHDTFDTDKVKNLEVDKRYFIFCDCEGCEDSIFTKENIPYFRNCDLIIELHEFIHSDIKTTIYNLFRESHEVSIITEDKRLPKYDEIDILDNIYLKDVHRLVNERRPQIMTWAVILSKES